MVTRIPTPRYYDSQDKVLASDVPIEEIAYTIYALKIKPGIRYQPHPAFAKDEEGRYLYHQLSSKALANKHTLRDFAKVGTRELVAADYAYQIKRLAHPRDPSPIFSIMAEYIVGLRAYNEQLKAVYDKIPSDQQEWAFLDLNRFPLGGVKVVDRYTYRIKIKGKYPQLLYWLAMPFFAPMPVEAERFYSQKGLMEKNISLNWYPIGTGPYMLTENNPNLRMVLEKNPNYHGERYPEEGDPGDRENGFLADAGKALPFIDKAIFVLEKENIPYWSKFLQGYYDSSGLSSDSFDQAVQFNAVGEAVLSDSMKDKGIRLQTAVQTATMYTGFNMFDDLVGGLSEKTSKLRRAISIAVDMEEYISIFLNNRALPAQGVLPPGIFGHREGEKGINPYVYDWKHGKVQRKSLAEAKKLLTEAGYENGIDPSTGKALQINYDVIGSGNPDRRAQQNWYRKQLKKLGIDLVIRSTNYSRFQDKMSKGDAQIFSWGWFADYPDPENFLFLLYGENAQAKTGGGVNHANYENAEFDRLYQKMKNMDSGPERQKIIDQMMAIARHDSPWIWGYHPKAFTLYHRWLSNTKANVIGNNELKYKRVDPNERARLRQAWNKPIVWPMVLVAVLLFITLIPAVKTYRRRSQYKPGAPGGDS